MRGHRLKLSREDLDAMFKSAVDAYGGGRLRDAEKILVGLTRFEEGDPRPYALLGAIYMLGNHHRQADAAFRRALVLQPDEPFVLVALAEIALDALRFGDAFELLERLFALDPDLAHPATCRGKRLLEQAQARLSGSSL